ncbi:MAG: GlcG/HbpS family heme-binding protein, partial [Burkholderiales bacterium]
RKDLAHRRDDDRVDHSPEPCDEKEILMLTLNDARKVIAAAEKKAAEIGQPQNIAVADAGGNLVAHARMDGAWIGSIDISIKKAFTSRAFDISTKDLATHSQSGGQFFGIHASNDGRVMIFAGGIPLKRDGKVVGAIGVSGGSGEQDHAVAEAGAAAFK